MSGSKNTITWETLQKGNDGKLSLQLEGEQLYVQPTDDGKMEVVGANGKVLSVLDYVNVVDPNDPKVIEIAKAACAKNGVKFERVILGVKVNLVVGAVYCLIISATDSKGASKLFFTAVFESFFKRVIMFFANVPRPF